MAADTTSTLTIGRLAERTGFTTSALRYYENHGLLAPVARSAAGYRLYDESSEARLRFIVRAKQLGCSLDEIADLVSLAGRDDCAPVQARLHALVTDRIAEAQRRSAELVSFAAELQEAARSLGAEPVDGPCRPGCACIGPDGAGDAGRRPDPKPVVLGRRDDPEIACTLPADAIDDRLADWQRLLDHVVGREPVDGGLRLAFGPDVPGDELLRLTTAEQTCCAFFAFAITVDHRGLALEVRAPGQAADLVTEVFGAA